MEFGSSVPNYRYTLSARRASLHELLYFAVMPCAVFFAHPAICCTCFGQDRLVLAR